MSYEEQYDKAKKEGKVTNLTPVFKEWEKEGEYVLGKLVAITEVTGSLSPDPYNQYVFDTDTGLVKCALGGATDREMKNTLLVGGVYRVLFQGKVDLKGGKSVNKFQIDEVVPPPAAE